MVQMQRLQQLHMHYDTNRDGQLSRAETAQASLSLLGAGPEADALINNTLSPEQLAQFQTEGSLFATMVQGGVDGAGLFPDADGNGGISIQELAQLAAADGDGNSVSSQDFQNAFGNRFQAGGNAIDINGLQTIASENNPLQGVIDGANQVAQNPLDGQVFQMFTTILQTFIQMLSFLFNPQPQ